MKIDFPLSHLGFVVWDIDSALISWEKSDYYVVSPKVWVSEQEVFCALLGHQYELPIELISPPSRTELGPLTSRLGRGGGLDHICYEAPNIESVLEIESKSVRISGPSHSPLFNRFVVFFLRETGLVVEYVLEKHE